MIAFKSDTRRPETWGRIYRSSAAKLASGEPVYERPFQMLWSWPRKQLIGQVSGMFGDDVIVFQLSDDLATITERTVLAEATLVPGIHLGWQVIDQQQAACRG